MAFSELQFKSHDKSEGIKRNMYKTAREINIDRKTVKKGKKMERICKAYT